MSNTGAGIMVACAAAVSVAQPVMEWEDVPLPPRVVATEPALGEMGVDPAATELRVTFDRDMVQRGFSFVGGGPSFPKLMGQPRWIDARTCIAPIELEPDRDYRVGINSEIFTNFRGIDGVPAEPFPLWFSTRRGESVIEAANIVAIAELRAAVEDRYSYADLRGVDWDARFERFEHELRCAQTAEAFAMAAADLLGAACDMHVSVRTGDVDDGVMIGSYAPAPQRNVNMRLLGRFVGDLLRESSMVVTGEFEDGIGYIMLSSFTGGRNQLLPALRAIERFRDAPGLVIDVRTNGGGDESLARMVAGRFVTEPVVYARHLWRDPDAADGFSTMVDRVLMPAEEAEPFAGNVVVLMGEGCMSSCEAFLLMMRAAPRAVLVGDRSMGASGNPWPVGLANGVTVLLPSWRALTAEGEAFEGVGIAPDVLVELEAGELEEGDPVLEMGLLDLRVR